MKEILIYVWLGISIVVISTLVSFFAADDSWVIIVSGVLLMMLFICILIHYRIKKAEWERDLQMKDETIEKAKEEETGRLRIMEEDVSQFKRKIAHSVRMPIAIISGYGDVLSKGTCSPEETDVYIAKICKNIKYLSNTFRLVLDNQEDVECTEFDARVAVAEVAEQAQQYLKKHNLRMEINSGSASVMMKGYETDLMRALYNLIENSIKYMKQGNTIYVTVEDLADEVLIIYRDNGVGLQSEEAEQLGKLNYQGTNAKNQVKGTGAGLYIVRMIMEKHGGIMDVRSSENKGFVVYMRFPKHGETLDNRESLTNL